MKNGTLFFFGLFASLTLSFAVVLLADPQAHRAAYVNYFLARLQARGRWLQGAIDARA